MRLLGKEKETRNKRRRGNTKKNKNKNKNNVQCIFLRDCVEVWCVVWWEWCARAEADFRLWGRNESQCQFEYGRGEGRGKDG
jgi:hypothetical protein